MNVHMTKLTLKKVRDVFVLNGLLFLEQLFDNGFPIGSIESVFPITIHAPLRTIEFIEHAVLFV